MVFFYFGLSNGVFILDSKKMSAIKKGRGSSLCRGLSNAWI